MKQEEYELIVNQYNKQMDYINNYSQRIEELECDSKVMEYLYLKQREREYKDVKAVDNLIYSIMRFSSANTTSTNNIWVFLYEEDYGKIKIKLNMEYPFKSWERVAIYKDIENPKSYMLVGVSEKEKFEENNKVVYGKKTIYDSSDRYFNTRYEFYKEMFNTSQEEAVQKILTLYK